MDDAMIGALLKTYGAPMTVDNANRARQFFATNPEIAEKRAMGMRGSGLDDNSDVFGAMLDQLIAKSAPTTGSLAPVGENVERVAPAKAAPIAPVEEVGNTMPTVQNATGQNRRNATVRENKTYPNPTEAQGTPNNVTGSTPATAPTTAGGLSWNDILTALLGASSVAGRTIMGGGVGPDSMETKLRQVGGADPRMPQNVPQVEGPNGNQKRLTYQPKLEEGGANARANQSTVVQEDPALANEGKKAQIQAEIDAENAEAKRLQDQIMQRNQRQSSTRDLLKSAKRTITGR